MILTKLRSCIYRINRKEKSINNTLTFPKEMKKKKKKIKVKLNYSQRGDGNPYIDYSLTRFYRQCMKGFHESDLYDPDWIVRYYAIVHYERWDIGVEDPYWLTRKLSYEKLNWPKQALKDSYNIIRLKALDYHDPLIDMIEDKDYNIRAIAREKFDYNIH